ncbi:MAG: hypothetical protein EPN21_03940 [Methylococcaceae bacterium]|nr:MAG: hypothetical protein EPN21_03940 [Methylococcaceae bacterium]
MTQSGRAVVTDIFGVYSAAPLASQNTGAAYSPWQEAASSYDVRNITRAEIKEMAKILFVRGAIDAITYALLRAERSPAAVQDNPVLETGRRYDYIAIYAQRIESRTSLGMTQGIEYEIHVLAVLDRIAAQRQNRLDMHA